MLLWSKLLRPALFGQPLIIEGIGTSIKHLLFKVLSSTRIAELQARALKGALSPLSTCPSNQVLDIDGTIGYHEQSVLLSVGSDHDIHSHPCPANNAIDRSCGKNIPINHSLEWHQICRHLTPALRVGVPENISAQFHLCLKQAVNGYRRKNLPRRLHTQFLGKIVVYTLCGRG